MACSTLKQPLAISLPCCSPISWPHLKVCFPEVKASAWPLSPPVLRRGALGGSSILMLGGDCGTNSATWLTYQDKRMLVCFPNPSHPHSLWWTLGYRPDTRRWCVTPTDLWSCIPEVGWGAFGGAQLRRSDPMNMSAKPWHQLAPRSGQDTGEMHD